MKIKIIIILGFCLFFVLSALPGRFVKVSSENTNDNRLTTACPTPVTTKFFSYSQRFPLDEAFCQAGNKPFELRQDYPTALPASEDLPWRKIVTKKDDFKAKWREYLLAILKYGFEGNLEENWIVQNNKKRKWYHAPYMDADAVGFDSNGKDTFRPMGREYIHGLTQERTTCLEELKGEKSCLSSSPKFQNWAVSVYNEPGGYYIGEVWRELFTKLNTTKPIPIPNPADIWKELPEGFPEETVAIKLLFTEADDEMLAGTIEWQANINVNTPIPVPPHLQRRETKTMRLMQIDVAVRERKEISPTGWVFGTFVFQKGNAATISYPSVHSGWLRFVPIGLTYGNGEGESFNEDNANLAHKQHQGCDQYLESNKEIEKDLLKPGKARTNGPIDNPISSCISCHSAAETSSPDEFTFENLFRKYPNECSDRTSYEFWYGKANSVLHINPRITETTNLAPNIFVRKTLEAKAISLDYSLQLRSGIDRCCRDGRLKLKTGCSCEKDNILNKHNLEMIR